MASENKKRKCHNTLLDRGGEKGKLFRLKRDAMYHKKDRNYNKKMCKESEEWLGCTAEIVYETVICDEDCENCHWWDEPQESEE